MKDNISLNHLMESMRDLKKEYDQLIEPHRKALWSYCRMITGSPWDAEDLVQETLLKSYSALPRIFQTLIPKSYLFRIATNTWLNQKRKEQPLLIENYQDEPAVEQTDPLVTREAIERLVITLSPKQRVAILLCDVFDFRGKEVAEMIGSTESGVKALLHRARINLKKTGDNDPYTDIKERDIHTPVIDAYLDAFNRRDPDAIASLLDDQATNDIVHTSYEYGKDIIRKHSLDGWAHDPMPMKATYQWLWGKPVVVVMTKVDGQDYVYDLIDLEVEAGAIVHKRDYYFCQDLLKAAGEELGVPAHENGYIYLGD